MNDLERYIREHAAQFDTAEPAEGHEARFLARADKGACLFPAGGRKLFRSALHDAPARKALFLRPVAWAFALAAAVALLLVIRPGASRHFLGVPDNPERVYRSYLAQVERAYREFPWEDADGWEQTLDELTEEPVSLYEQLPEELPRRQQARILKAYYGGILDEVNQLKNKR